MRQKITPKQFAEFKRQQMRILRLSDKCFINKQSYREKGVFKQRFVPTNESRSINQPVNRFTVATKKESRNNYKFNRHLWRIDEKPKEWIRLNHRDLLTAKIISKQKYL